MLWDSVQKPCIYRKTITGELTFIQWNGDYQGSLTAGGADRGKGLTAGGANGGKGVSF